jgi:F-type H+-transporting ATPase subunit b
MGSIALDWTTFALEIVNFLVLLWLLKRFLYRPVAEALARRRAHIERSLTEGREAKAKAEALEKQYEGRLAEWERERARARAGLARELEAERSQRLAELSAALERERERREAAAARDADQRRREAEHEALEQGAAFAARLTGALAGPELEAHIIELAVARIRGLPQDKQDALRAAGRGSESAATVRSAYPLSDTQRDQLTAALDQAAGAKLRLGFATDRDLVAGLRVELGAWVLSANVRDELAAFADSANERR